MRNLYPKLKNCSLREVENLYLYNFKKDELYELDREAFEFLRHLSGSYSVEELVRIFGKEVFDILKFLEKEDCIEYLNRSIGKKHKISVKKSTIPSLRYLQLHITEKCNLRCRHCYLGRKSGRSMDPDLAKRILDEFSEVGFKLIITGGEPLLYENLWEFLSYARKKDIRIVVLSNGTLIDESIAKKLSKYVDEVQISLDGLKNGHEFLRGKGTFAKTIRGIKNARKYLRVSVATMIHKENVDEFPKLSKLVNKIADEWFLDVPALKGNATEDTLPDFNKAIEILIKYGFSSATHEGSDEYSCGSHLASVDVDGYLAKCGFFEPICNAGKGLIKCWIKIVRKMLPKLKELECKGCKYIRICRGGCRYRATLQGNFYSRDKLMCMLFQRLEHQKSHR